VQVLFEVNESYTDIPSSPKKTIFLPLSSSFYEHFKWNYTAAAKCSYCYDDDTASATTMISPPLLPWRIYIHTKV